MLGAVNKAGEDNKYSGPLLFHILLRAELSNCHKYVKYTNNIFLQMRTIIGREFHRKDDI